MRAEHAKAAKPLAETGSPVNPVQEMATASPVVPVDSLARGRRFYCLTRSGQKPGSLGKLRGTEYQGFEPNPVTGA